MLENKNVSFSFEPINESMFMTVVAKTNNTGSGYDGLLMLIIRDYFHHLTAVMPRI